MAPEGWQGQSGGDVIW